MASLITNVSMNSRTLPLLLLSMRHSEFLDSSETATAFQIDLPGHRHIDVEGTGFTYDASGTPTGGTVTSFAVLRDGWETPSFSVTDISIPVTTFLAYKDTPVAGMKAILSGDDTITGSKWSDILNGFAGDDAIDGGRRNDLIYGGDGDDTLVGGSGNDRLYGGGGNDSLSGGSGNDRLDGGNDDDSLEGGSGNDRLAGRDGHDDLFGGAGHDQLVGGDGDDSLEGGSGHDKLTGGDGSDTLLGGGGRDNLNGGGGQDVLNGGENRDTLRGGADADVFVFDTALVAGSYDVVADLAVGVDKVHLDDDVFQALAAGALPANAFHIGTAAATTDQHIIYDNATGRLFYDADGSDAGEAIQFARLKPNLALTENDFLVIA
jgi:Ca2+-binding RTX toxin-like protein